MAVKKNQPSKVFIDFDDCLINTRVLKKDYFKIFIEFGFLAAEIEASYKKSTDRQVYNISNHLKFLRGARHDKKLAGLKMKLENFFKNSKKYVFKDSEPFLRQLRGRKFKVFLISMGDKKIQMDKIKSSGLAKLFDRVYVVDDYYKSQCLKNLKVSADERFIFIDDKAKLVDDIKTHFPQSLAIQLQRYKDQDRSKKADFYARNLNQCLGLA